MMLKKYLVIITVLVSCSGLMEFKEAQAQKGRRHQEKLVDTLIINPQGEGIKLIVSFAAGSKHNHPLFAFWMEDTEGNYIQTLYVSKSIAKGVFEYGDKSTGKWQPGEIERPAALPYWAHKRNVLNEKGNFMPTAAHPVADAYSGATPPGNFILIARSDQNMSGTFRLMAEINQSWDWNEHWTNSKFPGDMDYFSSAQPAVVYEAVIDMDKPGVYEFKAVGRSHHSGKTGELFTDLQTLTTALEIAQSISVMVEK